MRDGRSHQGADAARPRSPHHETLEWDGLRAIREAVVAGGWMQGGDLGAVERAVAGR